MVVEMCGLPGCGKTTLIEQSRPNLNNVYNRRKVFKDVRFRSQIFKIIPTNFPVGKEYQILREFVLEYPNSSSVFVSKLYRLNYALNASKSKMILLDEGPIQHITSIAFDEKLMDDMALDGAISVLCKDEPLVFYCKCPIDVTIQRLASRKANGYTNNGRYDVVDIDRLKFLLEVKENNIQKALNHFNGTVIELDMRSSYEKNVCIMRKQIESLSMLLPQDLWAL